jgi:hypothetical protein
MALSHIANPGGRFLRPIRILAMFLIFASMVDFITEHSLLDFNFMFLLGALALLWDSYRQHNVPARVMNTIPARDPSGQPQTMA